MGQCCYTERSGFPWYRQPDLGGILRREVVKSRGRQQANDAPRRQLGRFRKGMVLRERCVRVDVKTPPGLQQFALLDQLRQIGPWNARRLQVARRTNPALRTSCNKPFFMVYRVFFTTVYACGLRLGEAVQLQVSDVDGLGTFRHAQ